MSNALPPNPVRSRGLVILVVMVVVTLSALIGSSVLLLGENASVSATHDRRSAQSRLAAWSGVQAVMARLHEQRDDLLDGGAPVLPESWTFPVESDIAPAFRVVGAEGRLAATSENAKLDVNLATAEMLEALPMIDADLARAIVGARPFESVAELGSVPGVTPALLYGDRGGELEPDMLPLSEVLTVFAFDPNIQLGAGEQGEEHRGNQRVNLGLGWSDALERAVIDRWDESVAEILKSLFEQGESLKRTSDVVALYRRFGASPEDWIEGLDALTTIDSEHVRGLVDLNRASPEVLGAVPGIDENKARDIADARERLGLDQRRSIVWPVIEGILTQDEFQEACDWLTTRSMQWRVRVEGGSLIAGEGGDELSESAEMRDRVVVECVIDVSSRRPRVAYLRDVTGLELALALGASPDEETDPIDEPEEPVPGEVFEPAGVDRPAPPEPAQDESETESEPVGGGRIGRWAVDQGSSS